MQHFFRKGLDLSKYPDIEILENLKNLGYAGGNNAGMRFLIKKGTDLMV